MKKYDDAKEKLLNVFTDICFYLVENINESIPAHEYSELLARSSEFLETRLRDSLEHENPYRIFKPDRRKVSSALHHILMSSGTINYDCKFKYHTGEDFSIVSKNGSKPTDIIKQILNKKTYILSSVFEID